MTTAGHKVLASHIESLLECLTKYKERFNKDNFRHQTIYHTHEIFSELVGWDSHYVPFFDGNGL
jgi:hypothetical protein